MDAALGVLAAGCLLGEEQLRGFGSPGQPLSLLLAAAVGVTLTQRRRAPVPVLGVTLALLLAALPVMDASFSTLAIAMLAAATAAYQGQRRRSLLVGLALLPVLGVFILVGGDWHESGQQLYVDLVPLLAAVAAADALRSRGQARLARGEREQAVRAAAVREMFDAHRLHLARELHDSVAHALVGINTQAAVAAHLHARDADPELLAVLTQVKTASAAALRELRDTLARLREDQVPAPVRPGTSGLDDVQTLVQPLRSAGLDVRLDWSPVHGRIPTPTAHAAYRITQEALTNVLRHAHAHVVEVGLTLRDHELHLSVADDGRVAAIPDVPGHGLLGMRERAATVGGKVDAGPRPTGGWLVSARLPVGPDV